MVHTQLRQVSRPQQDLFRDMLKQQSKHAYGVGTRCGKFTHDALCPEGHPKRIEQDSQRVNDSAPSLPKKKKKKSRNKTMHASNEHVIEEPVENPNNVSISDAKTHLVMSMNVLIIMLLMMLHLMIIMNPIRR